jgi:hypothetical protein
MSTEFFFICAGAGGMGILGFALALRLGHVPGQGATAGRDIGTQAGRDAVTHHHVTDHQRMLDYFCQAKDLQRTVDILSEQLMARELTNQEYLGELRELWGGPGQPTTQGPAQVAAAGAGAGGRGPDGARPRQGEVREHTNDDI